MLLRAERLEKIYGKRRVVHEVSLCLAPGEIVGLLGPNGAGKTTTFYMIVGFIRPDAGEIYLGEERITHLPMYKRAQRGIGYLPQEASIFRRMSVEDNLRTVLELQKGLSPSYIQTRIEQLLEEFGLKQVRHSLGQQLSGGERRRAEIARALASNPQYLLLDEPFAGVDPIAVEEIQSIILRLAQRGIGILITDHNVHETLGITHRAYLLYEGCILREGTAEQLAADPQVRRVYLGEKFQLIR
ncbi:MAG: LPS export ABC transporter ATP-binding protein [Bacteroidia bacterium]|nr:LPS export ABC transporter ATP-binding protein [Bacteroidia bacterium]MDW8014408.1 LPS export ABC transporter ATP-binding protein [Bacteroidia bacterium]